MNCAISRQELTESSADGRGSAVVVGASLAGLMTALCLSRAGIDVTMLERSDDSGRTGAAVHVGEGLLERLTGRSGTTALPHGVQTWFTVHGRLRAAVEADGRIELYQNVRVRDVGQDDGSAWAVTSDGRTFCGDIVVGADGHRSTVRRAVCPDNADATFAGYLIWLGLTEERALPLGTHWPGDVAFLESGDCILLGYPLPGPDGSTARGTRQLGWAWYDRGRNDLLRRCGCVADDIVRHSLTGADIPDKTYRELANEARRRWLSPWRDAILDCTDRHAVIGTPIAEYVPDSLAKGRLALVGDAAHVPTPMTGSGFGASLSDAEAMADAVRAGVRGDLAVAALRDYERMRLTAARSMVESGQQFSRRFADRSG